MRWRTPLVRLALLLAAVALPLASVVHGADAGLSTRFDYYLHRHNGDRADPINLVFVGADPDQVARQFEQVLGWRRVTGNDLVFLHQGQPPLTTMQLGFDLGHGSRYHVRIDQASEPGDAPYIFAAVHRDDLTPCGHIGHDFDAVRDLVASGFAAAGYPVTMVPLHNTEPGRQCDNSLTSGGGMAALIDLGQSAVGSRQ